MLMFLNRARGFLLHPKASFERFCDDEPTEAVDYFLILLGINSILSALLHYHGVATLFRSQLTAFLFGHHLGAATLFAALAGAFLAGFLMVAMTGAIIHLFVILLGGTGGVVQTYKAVIYASTPWLLLGWIPIVCFISGLWTIALSVTGIQQLQGLSPLRAAVAVLVPVLFILGVVAFTLLPLLYGDPYAFITRCYR